MTLLFYAGYIISNLRPWELTSIKHICVNFFDLYKRKKVLKRILDKGIREGLEIPDDCSILVDSGAFPAFKSKVSINRERVRDLYKSIVKFDDCSPILVNLDVIGDEKKSLENYLFFKEEGIDVMPVVHHPFMVISEYFSCPYIGIGGMVPVIRTHQGKRDAFGYIKSIVGKLPIPVHVFGLGSTLLPVLEKLGVFSADSIAWRRSASIGAVQLPTRQVHISGRGSENLAKWDKRPITPKEVELFVDPSPWSLNQLQDSFVDRAAFNLWIIQSVLQETWPEIENRWVSLIPEAVL